MLMNKLWLLTLCGCWILAMTFCIPLGWLFGLFPLVVEPPLFPALGFAITGCVLGLVTGVAQWFILDQALKPIVIWIPITVIGWSLAGVIFGKFFLAPSERVQNLFLLFFIGGIVSGILQWFLLRSRARKATLWLLTTFLGWFVGVGVAWIIPESDTGPLLQEIIIIGFFVGIVSVFALYAILVDAGTRSSKKIQETVEIDGGMWAHQVDKMAVILVVSPAEKLGFLTSG